MANGRLSANDVELIYPSNSGQRCDWFSIKQDKQTKQIRFLYDTIDDVYFDVVHEVNVNGRNRVISCLNSRGENVNDCPMCRAGYQQKVLLYIPVLDLEDGKVKIWTRSKGFLPTIQGLMMRNNPLSGTVFEVMRNGAKGDSKTTYLFQPIAMNDGLTVKTLLSQAQASLPEQSSYMDVYDFNQMQTYVQNLESIQGNIPVNRSAFNQQTPQFYSGYNGGASNNNPNYQQPYQNTTMQPQNQYSTPHQSQQQYSASPSTPAPTQPMVPPTNIPNQYQQTMPTPVQQMPINTPVRRPATPPPVPSQPLNNAVMPAPPIVGQSNNNNDDVPF